MSSFRTRLQDDGVRRPSRGSPGRSAHGSSRRARAALPGIGAAVVVLAVGLSGCAGARIGDTNAAAGGGGGAGAASGECGTLKLAMNDWVGYTADAAVLTYVARTAMGCTVQQLPMKEQIAWQGFGTGQVHVIVENWGHDDLKAKYIDQQKTAVSAGPTGNIGTIGWWVPPWLAKAHPDVLQWKNLNKYATQFATSESGGKGQLLDGDPSYVTNDEALVKNLNLNFKVVYAGSETALITSFRAAEQQKKWVIGYFYSPQWFLSEVPMQKVELPPYTPGCDADASKIACDYPRYDLDKIVAAKFAKDGGPAYQLVKNFQWTNDDQNLVAKYITADKMTPDAAAKKWVEANKVRANSWLAGIGGAKPF
ncbi:ABC transporter substrate-binding protein [Arsenicicoccus piscis]|nr:ABC transporter substrate-binding protein [Arsenicicoccus piscis]MCH8627982.1 ABC transporter substrate-binding protein [Arsenicicoccus piscis]